MTENGNEEQQNATEGPSPELSDVLSCLTYTQKRFVIARQETTTDKKAAENVGIRPHLVYEWKSRGFPIDEALRLIAENSVIMALDLRRKALAKAMDTKIQGLESDEETVKQRVATEIIEWELGKPIQRQEFSGPNEGPIEIADHRTELERRLLGIAANTEAPELPEDSLE